MTLYDVQSFRWSLNRYLDMAESGVLANENVELIDGNIIDMAPQKDAHALAVCNTIEELLPLFRRPFWVKGQSTFRLSEWSAPEPDVVVLPRREDFGRELHDTPLLVVEVSETTLSYDRGAKASLYASRGVADYWVINLIDDQIEVFRQPAQDAQAEFNWRYAWTRTYRRGERVDLLARPDQSIPVESLLP